MSSGAYTFGLGAALTVAIVAAIATKELVSSWTVDEVINELTKEVADKIV